MVRAFLTAFLIALVPMSAVAQSSTPSPSEPGSPVPNSGGIDKTGVFVDSLALLGIEHGIRLAFQPGTRRELRGNFWRDYYRSVRVPTACLCYSLARQRERLQKLFDANRKEKLDE